jgi:hypothetical protein
MFSFKELIEESKRTGCTCWTGYKRVPGTKPCESGSCIAMKKAGKKPKNEEVEINEGTADDLGDKIDNAQSDDHAKSIISKAKTKHLQYLHHWNMGLSGTRTHKDMPHIKAELTKRGAMLSPKESEKHFAEEVETQFDLIEQLIMDMAKEHNIDPEIIWENFEAVDDEDLYEAAVDAKGYKSSTGGLTQKGRDHFNAQSGGHLKAPVTTPPSKLKAGSKAANRRKSFCARMSGMEGPMKKPNGEPTRKALSLRKWNC